ncbi:polysaccharide deacetylase family protein [Massilia pseudoviolaceinigra]|uniref:polysaccharide deacetylase family protein n=1 Tax=Massilia pseudoviolaceinigra TaxID=3057165 RepID=UPI002796431B|nr:polysaccharide deacetylase family protein [Massilia sp. CCM 9206]MDQ1921017.1 polysaccharide deacetylase family protein [Massilia sp. CCM 9206]
MNRDATPVLGQLGQLGAQCNLCGSAMPAPGGDGTDVAALACPACASTPARRVMRRVFQALPAGLLAWRRHALEPGRHGVDPAWFGAPAPAGEATADFMAVELDPQGEAIGAALRRLTARGVLYVSGAARDASGSAQDLLQSMTTLLATQGLPCSVIAIDGADPGGAARLPAWLLLREAADAERWRQHLAAWPGAAPMAAGPVPDRFAPLRAELGYWQASGAECAFWWRDDDLIEDSAALRRLAALSQRHQAPVLMAVIPAEADAALTQATADAMPTLVYCQHGWAHVNHEAPGQPSSEFGPGRDPQAAEADLRQGAERLRALFGARFLPVMVPPWNTLAPALAARLPALGLHGLSQYLFQPRGAPLDGLVRVDAHLDIVDWSAGAGVRDPEMLVERLVSILQSSRAGRLGDPLGILTHHRVMADGSWRFVEQLLALTADYSCVRWLDPRTVFAAMPAGEGAPCAA